MRNNINLTTIKCAKNQCKESMMKWMLMKQHLYYETFVWWKIIKCRVENSKCFKVASVVIILQRVEHRVEYRVEYWVTIIEDCIAFHFMIGNEMPANTVI